MSDMDWLFVCGFLGVLWIATLWSAVGWRGKARRYTKAWSDTLADNAGLYRQIGALKIDNATLRDQLAKKPAAKTRGNVK